MGGHQNGYAHDRGGEGGGSCCGRSCCGVSPACCAPALAVRSVLSACTGGRAAEILAVDGVLLAGLSSDDTRALIFGAAGASVSLTVLPPGCSTPITCRLNYWREAGAS